MSQQQGNVSPTISGQQPTSPHPSSPQFAPAQQQQQQPQQQFPSYAQQQQQQQQNYSQQAPLQLNYNYQAPSYGGAPSYAAAAPSYAAAAPAYQQQQIPAQVLYGAPRVDLPIAPPPPGVDPIQDSAEQRKLAELFRRQQALVNLPPQERIAAVRQAARDLGIPTTAPAGTVLPAAPRYSDYDARFAASQQQQQQAARQQQDYYRQVAQQEAQQRDALAAQQREALAAQQQRELYLQQQQARDNARTNEYSRAAADYMRSGIVDDYGRQFDYASRRDPAPSAAAALAGRDRDFGRDAAGYGGARDNAAALASRDRDLYGGYGGARDNYAPSAAVNRATTQDYGRDNREAARTWT